MGVNTEFNGISISRLGNGERAPCESEFYIHRATALGDQAGTVETVHGFLQAVLLDQDDHLPTSLDKQSARSQAEFYLETKYLVPAHKNVDYDRQADVYEATFHQVCDLFLSCFKMP